MTVKVFTSEVAIGETLPLGHDAHQSNRAEVLRLKPDYSTLKKLKIAIVVSEDD